MDLPEAADPVSITVLVGVLTTWCLIETVGNVLLSLCIYFERVHNRRLYRGYRDRMLSAGAVLPVPAT